MALERESLERSYAGHISALQQGFGGALEAEGFAAMVLHSGSVHKQAEADDQYFPFRVLPHFAHWLPLAAPESALVVRPGEKPLLVWYKPYSYWESAPELPSDHWLGQFEIIEVGERDEIRRHLPREGVAMLSEHRSAPRDWGIDALNPPALVERLDQLRVHKTDYEIACIREANRTGAMGHERVRDLFLSGDHAELDLHLAFLAATRQDDAETPYKNILALGPHAAVLHHVVYGRQAIRRPAESLLIDAGGSYLGYCSDITRTYVKGTGEPARRFAELIARVDAMQQVLCSEVAAGLPYPELHQRAHAQVAAILHDMGVFRIPAAEALEAGLTRAFFPHGLGHSLGLQCHDVGCAREAPTEATDWLRHTSDISTGQVFSIEPGIYFIKGKLDPLRAGVHASAIDWRLVDELAQFGGVRIEDDVWVQGSGAGAGVNLTRPFLS